jgi:tRNA wybutosine-synthesizing protein 2
LYPPLLLLPSNFASYSPNWQSFYSGLDRAERDDLFASICRAFKGHGASHIAINAPISNEDAVYGHSNAMRSPAGLVPVFGDFGPSCLTSGEQPGPADFDAAFWTSAVQNGGITQVWAPLWTMFSRGNISEKARILGNRSRFSGMTDTELGQKLSDIEVIDFYVGIGYFAFSYLKRGVRRVWGWEINGWSVEGLRRGAEKNGWKVCVIEVGDKGLVSEVRIAQIARIMSKGDVSESRCVVFHGDNKWAAQVMAVITGLVQASERVLHIRHANLGLLPTSRTSWENSVQVLDQQMGGWLHVHENVDVNEIDAKSEDVVSQIKKIVTSRRGASWTVSCCHVEQVKTYAPGVMHCVFDIEILPAR